MPASARPVNLHQAAVVIFVIDVILTILIIVSLAAIPLLAWSRRRARRDRVRVARPVRRQSAVRPAGRHRRHH